jgi:hypothetical protein
MTVGHEHLSALWLATLQRIIDRIAHDLRNTLNGVAVNVEVVRSRAARGGDPATIAPFASVAATQVEILSNRTDALVGILRPAAPPIDLGALLGRLVAVLRPADGEGAIDLELPVNSGQVSSAASGDATRLAVGAALLAALERGGRTGCRLGTDRPSTVYISSEPGGPLTLAPDIVDAVMREGISLSSSPTGIVLTFPSGSRD